MQFANPLSGDLIIGTVNIDGGSLDNLGSLTTITDPVATYGYGSPLVDTTLHGSGSYSLSFTPSTGQRFLALLLSGQATNVVVKVTGNQTNFVYYSASAIGGTAFYDFAPIVPEVDSSYTLSITNAASFDNIATRVVGTATSPIVVPVNDSAITARSSPLRVNPVGAEFIAASVTVTSSGATIIPAQSYDYIVTHLYITNLNLGNIAAGNVNVGSVNLCTYGVAPGMFDLAPYALVAGSLPVTVVASSGGNVQVSAVWTPVQPI